MAETLVIDLCGATGQRQTVPDVVYPVDPLDAKNKEKAASIKKLKERAQDANWKPTDSDIRLLFSVVLGI